MVVLAHSKGVNDIAAAAAMHPELDRVLAGCLLLQGSYGGWVDQCTDADTGVAAAAEPYAAGCVCKVAAADGCGCQPLHIANDRVGARGDARRQPRRLPRSDMYAPARPAARPSRTEANLCACTDASRKAFIEANPYPQALWSRTICLVTSVDRALSVVGAARAYLDNICGCSISRCALFFCRVPSRHLRCR